MFQLTRPRGARPNSQGPAADTHKVSTHAPAWGATRVAGSSSVANRGFNSRARVGRDSWEWKGEFPKRRFNSRARVGRDLSPRSASFISGPFQLTRPRGARPSSETTPCGEVSFNSRARVGRDLAYRISHFRYPGFNSRARVGRDPSVTTAETALRSFNSRARVGRDLVRPKDMPVYFSFNSRARVGRD